MNERKQPYNNASESRAIIPIDSNGLECVVPEVGMIFTARAEEPNSLGNDFRTHLLPNHTGYIKPRSPFYEREPVTEGKYRFCIVGGPFTQNHHNYFQAIIFRELLSEGFENDENGPDLLLPNDFGTLKYFAEGRKSKPTIYSPTIQNDLTWLIQTTRWRNNKKSKRR